MKNKRKVIEWNTLRKLLFAFCVCTCTLPLFAQQTISVTGTVIDKNGEPAIGANIAVKGTAKGTTTDVEGKFSLNVPDNAVLQVSYLGYITQEISDLAGLRGGVNRL